MVEIFALFLSPGPVAFPFLFPSLETASFSQEKTTVFLVPSEEAIYFFLGMGNQGAG
jgi:hypothetical protein